MRAVWLRVRTGLRHDWRSPLVLAVITGLVGGVVLAALAGAHRTQTAVPRFLQYSGPTEGQVAADPRTLSRIAALPDVAYSELGSFMLAVPVTAQGRMAVQPGQVITWALLDHPPQDRVILVAGRPPVASRADEAMLNESAARVLHAHVGSVIQLRGFRPSEMQQMLNGATLAPRVVLPRSGWWPSSGRQPIWPTGAGRRTSPTSATVPSTPPPPSTSAGAPRWATRWACPST